jgi:hypothetical protein
MNTYEESKKARRITSVLYLIILGILVTGTYLSEQQKEAAKQEAKDLKMSGETPGGFSENSVQN